MKKILGFSLLRLTILFVTSYSSIVLASQPSLKNSTSIEKDHARSQALGWVISENPCYLCGGYYSEPTLNFAKYGLIEEKDTHITADSGSLFASGRSILSGHVVMLEPNKLSESDQAYIYRNATTHEIERVDLLGHVRIREPGRLVLGESARIELTKHIGFINQPVYRIARSDKGTLTPEAREFYGVNAWGVAKKAEEVRKGYYIFDEATYSTCAPTGRDWEISAKKIILDNTENKGKAYHAVFRFHDVPVFYTPYYSFPLHHERKTGFLTPTPGYSNRSGYELALPFYWNMAPNYDATITPHYYSKRGLMTEGEFRYLRENMKGEISGSFLPHDSAFNKLRKEAIQNNQPPIHALGKNDRASFAWQHHMIINPNWSNDIDFNYVSDDYYNQDFKSAVAGTLNNQLLQQADINYHDPHWTFLGRVQNYETLRIYNEQGVADVYSRLPQLLANGYYPAIYDHTNFNVKSEFVFFRWPNALKTNGTRFLFDPSFDFPFKSTYGYLTPRIELHSRFYELTNPNLQGQKTVSRAIPLVSVDTGLYFDRQMSWFHHPYTQTLEPRLFYLYVPFSNQNDIPLFDTGLYTFTYDQLFRTNRFSGDDRIGDANQLTFAVSSRILDRETGEEKWRFALGDIFYFQNRRVDYCTGLGANCLNPIFTSSPFANFSPVVGLAQYHFNNLWSARADLAVQIQSHKTNTNINNGHLSLHYQSPKNRIFDFHYGFESSVLSSTTDPNTNITTNTSIPVHQIGFASAWPLSSRWSLLGAFSYNIQFSHPQTAFAGLQYDSCCWAFRVLGVRSLTSVDQQDNTTYKKTIYFQMELKGLGIFGNDEAGNVLTTNIPGFYDFLGTKAEIR